MIMRPIGRAYMPKRLSAYNPESTLRARQPVKMRRGLRFGTHRLMVARPAPNNAMQAVEGLGADPATAGSAITGLLQAGTGLYLQNQDRKAVEAAAAAAKRMSLFEQQQADADRRAANELQSLAARRAEADASASRNRMLAWTGGGVAALVGIGGLIYFLKKKKG